MSKEPEVIRKPSYSTASSALNQSYAYEGMEIVESSGRERAHSYGGERERDSMYQVPQPILRSVTPSILHSSNIYGVSSEVSHGFAVKFIVTKLTLSPPSCLSCLVVIYQWRCS